MAPTASAIVLIRLLTRDLTLLRLLLEDGVDYRVDLLRLTLELGPKILVDLGETIRMESIPRGLQLLGRVTRENVCEVVLASRELARVLGLNAG